MNSKLNDNILMNMVFNGLCRVLKNRKIYYIFRCFMGYGNGSKLKGRDLTNTLYTSFNCMQKYVDIAHHTSSENPFMYTSSKKDIFKILSENIGGENIIKEDDNNDVGKVQLRITQLINTLMHCCLEKTVNNFHILEEIGQETFELVCRKIYGENFVDETENRLPDNIKKMLDAQREYLGNANGLVDLRMLSRDHNFIEFLKSKGVIDDDGNHTRRIGMIPSFMETPMGEEQRDWDIARYTNTDFVIDDDFLYL